MNLILNIIVPVFGMAVIGFGSGRLGLLNEAAARGLSDFVFRIAIPIMLFETLGSLALPSFEWQGMIAYYSSCLFIYTGSALCARYLLNMRAESAGSIAMGAAFSNTVLLALPIVMKIHGPDNMTPMFLIISCHTTVLFGVGTVLVETWRADGSSVAATSVKILKGLITNPIIIGLTSGALFNVSGLTLPPWLDEIADMFTRAAVPCALFSMGLSLSSFRMGGNMGHITLIISAKLLLHPLLMWLLARYVFDLNNLWTSIAVISAAMPSGVNSYLFACGYRSEEATLAAAVLAGTGISMVTISVLLMLGI